jgi:hypothetical protein
MLATTGWFAGRWIAGLLDEVKKSLKCKNVSPVVFHTMMVISYVELFIPYISYVSRIISRLYAFNSQNEFKKIKNNESLQNNSCTSK